MHTEQSVRGMSGAQVYLLLEDVPKQRMINAIAYLSGLNPEACADVLNDIEGVNDGPEPEPCPSVAEHSGRQCTETGEHVRHRNGMVVWGPGVTEPEPGTQAYADKYASATVQRELLGAAPAPQAVAS